MEMPEYVYWMPLNKPGFVLPDQYQFQAATVIKVVKGQKLDYDLYFSLLADRVQKLFNECDNPEDELFDTYNALEGLNLITIYEQTSNLSKVGEMFVFNNHQLQEHLCSAGVFRAMPKVLEENNPEAEQLYNEVDFEGWSVAIATRETDDYR
jgi:hypothetical protein